MLNLIPLRWKLYAAIFALGLLALLRVRSDMLADAVDAYAKEIEHEDHERAIEIRRAAGRVSRSDRVPKAPDERGYRD